VVREETIGVLQLLIHCAGRNLIKLRIAIILITRTTIWAGHVARNNNVYKILVGKVRKEEIIWET
jgi:hypothetical protein